MADAERRVRQDPLGGFHGARFDELKTASAAVGRQQPDAILRERLLEAYSTKQKCLLSSVVCIIVSSLSVAAWASAIKLVMDVVTEPYYCAREKC